MSSFCVGCSARFSFPHIPGEEPGSIVMILSQYVWKGRCYCQTVNNCASAFHFVGAPLTTSEYLLPKCGGVRMRQDRLTMHCSSHVSRCGNIALLFIHQQHTRKLGVKHIVGPMLILSPLILAYTFSPIYFLHGSKLFTASFFQSSQ